MKKMLLSILIGWSCLSLGLAQYPINASIVLPPPNTPFLEELTDPISGLMGTLLLLDQNELSYDVRLKISISGQGIRLTTAANYIPPPITLTYGVPYTLTGVDFTDYINPYNLDFQGMSRGEFLRSGGQLPEGNYTVCIEVFDLNRFDQPALSDKGCTLGTFELHDPPLLIQPKGEQIAYTPQQVIFFWTPLHFGTFMVEYDLQIWERIPNLTDDQIISTHPPLFQTTSPILTYLYGVANPILEIGQDYIYRVRVRTLDGRAIFKNTGYSVIESFILLAPAEEEPTACEEWTAENAAEIAAAVQEVIDTRLCRIWDKFCGTSGHIQRDGGVAIGTNRVPDGYKLAVAEGIISKKLKICDTGGWCDYVFEEDYKLMALSEVDAHIQQYGYLPNPPSPQSDDYNVGENVLHHQEKIEEAFLHLISLKKEADALEKDLKQLKEKNKKLKRKVEKKKLKNEKRS